MQLTYFMFLWKELNVCLIKSGKGSVVAMCLFMPAQGPVLHLENDCGTTLTMVYSLGEAITLIRLLPLPDEGMAITQVSPID